jgi:ATP-dependent Clp protease ATP-binding subunit ClpA
MPKINVYLSDELADAVRRARIPVSSVCQRALADAVAAADGPPVAGGRPQGAGPTDGSPDLSRFTNRARQIVSTAQDAREHPTSVDIVGGLIAEGQNVALTVLRALDVDPDDLSAELRGLIAAGNRADDLAAVLHRAVEQALGLGHNYVGSEHLLLGILSAPAGEVTADALRSMGVDEGAARRGVSVALAAITYARDSGLHAGLTSPIRSALEEIRTRLAHLESR